MADGVEERPGVEVAVEERVGFGMREGRLEMSGRWIMNSPDAAVPSTTSINRRMKSSALRTSRGNCLILGTSVSSSCQYGTRCTVWHVYAGLLLSRHQCSTVPELEGAGHDLHALHFASPSSNTRDWIFLHNGVQLQTEPGTADQTARHMHWMALTGRTALLLQFYKPCQMHHCPH